MSERTSDRECRSTGSFQTDLSNLVIWAHTHGTICKQVPVLEFMQNMGHIGNDSAVLWMCRVGHAYHWHFEKSHKSSEEETEAVGRRKRVPSSESLARESSFQEKRLKLTPTSFEVDPADSGSTGSCDRSQGVTEQKADSTYKSNNKPSGSQSTRKPITSFSAAEQHFPTSGSRVQTDKQDIKFESNEKLQIISDEEQCEADEDSQGDRISQDNVSEPPAEELQMLHRQEMASHQPTASSRAKPPLSRTCILQPPGSSSENPCRNVLKPSSTAAELLAGTSRARSLLCSAVPKVCLRPLRVPSTEAKAQPESQASEIFFELQATGAVQQHLQLSSLECGTPGASSTGDGAENVDEDSEASRSRQTPCSSAFQSPGSHPPAASSGDMLKKQVKKKSHTFGDIKAFQEWLMLHHPSETREIHMLPPADLNRYLVSFFNSVKRQNGMDFSASTLHFFKHSISRYLRNHNYQYSMLRGPEFRASQEAYKLKYWYLFQKEKQENWSFMENLTDEDVEKLLQKGILSKKHPQGLLQLILTNFIRGFGASTQQRPHQLCWGQVVLRKTKREEEYLEWKDDLSPGGNEGNLNPRLFAKPEDPENCPVASYKEYAGKRPPDMLNDNHPLYLYPKPLSSIWDKVWYSRKALTEDRTNKILRVIIQEVRGTVKKTRK